MGLIQQIISVAFNQGLDTKSDSKQVIPGKLTALQNLIFKSPEALSLRNGYQAIVNAIGSGGSVVAGVTLSTLGSGLVLADGQSVYSYSENQAKWDAKGFKATVDVTSSAITGNASNVSLQDSAVHSSGAAIYSWIDSQANTVSYSVVDSTTQAPIFASGTSVSGTSCKPATVGSNFVQFIQNGGNIQTVSMPVSNPSSAGSPTNLVSITSGSAPFDLCQSPTSTYLFYVNASGVPTLTSFNSALTQVNTVSLTSETAQVMTCLYDANSSLIWVFYYNGTQIRCAIYNSNLTVSHAPFTVATDSSVVNLSAVTSSSVSTLFYEVQGSSADTQNIKVYSVTTGAVSSNISSLRSVGLASKAFLSPAGIPHIVTVHDSTLQSTYFLVQPTGFQGYSRCSVAAKLAPLNAGGLVTGKTLPFVWTQASGKFQFPYLLRINSLPNAGKVSYTNSLLSAVFNFNAQPGKLQLGNNLHLSGGVLTSYDGASAVEHGFHLFPETLTSQQNNLGGIAAGNYSYVAVYEWADSLGQLQRSAPSAALAVTVGPETVRIGGDTGSSAFTVDIPGGTGYPKLYPGMLVNQSTEFAANTLVASITDGRNGNATTFGLSGGPFLLPGSFSPRTTFSGSTVTGNTPTLSVSDPDGSGVGFTAYTAGDVKSGSNQVFFYNQPVAVVGSTVSDVSGFIPAGATIVSSVAKNGGALVTLSANTTGTITNEVLTVHSASTTFPPQAYVYPGQTISNTGAAIPPVIRSYGSGNNIVINQTTFGSSNNLVVSDTYGVTIQVPTLRVTEKGRNTTPVNIILYRTTSNGSIYYRIASGVNDPSVDTITISDSSNDTQIIGSQQLYTTGGEVDNISTPASKAMCSYKNRVILVPSENPYCFWYSKQVIPGFPAEFSDLFVQNLDQRGGGIIAVAEMNDKLILLKQSAVEFMVGEGPAPSGANNDFSYPQLIPTGTGCSSAASVVLTPLGLMYQSPKGIQLLDLSLTEQYIGAEVEAFNSYTVTSAQLIPDTTQVRLTLSNGIALVYDYFVRKWSTFTNISAVDSAVYNGKFCYLQSSGTVMEETPGVYTDNGSAIVPSLTTGWLCFAGLQGYQRVWRFLLLGSYFSPHTLNVSVAYDFDSTVKQTDAIAVPASQVPYEYRLHLAQQKCSSIQLTISGTPSVPYGQGLSLSALAFEVGAKKGLNKLPAGQSYG